MPCHSIRAAKESVREFTSRGSHARCSKWEHCPAALRARAHRAYFSSASACEISSTARILPRTTRGARAHQKVLRTSRQFRSLRSLQFLVASLAATPLIHHSSLACGPVDADSCFCEGVRCQEGLTLERNLLARRATRRTGDAASQSLPRVCRRAARSASGNTQNNPCKCALAPSAGNKGPTPVCTLAHADEK